MPAEVPRPTIRRLRSAREAVIQADLDALVVTHLPNIRYLTGFSGSAGAVVLTRMRCLLVVDFRYVAAAEALVAARGDGAVELHRAEADYDGSLVAILKEEGVRRIGIEGAWMPVSRFNRLSAALEIPLPGEPGSGTVRPALVPIEGLIERLRVIKDPIEIATLREAATRLSAVARRLRDHVRIGRSEMDVAAEIDADMRRSGFERPAFETIVASGPNGALPHARPSQRPLQQGEGVVLDFGGVYDGYCVDLTRTIQLGAWAPDFRRMFDAVAEAQTAAIAAVRPGARASAIDAAARDVLERHGLGEAFGHGTGHGLGLEVHEEPRIARAVAGWPDAAIQPGMIVTIEPGAYVAGLGGVRIEDDVLVTDAGCEVLTDVPVEL